MAASSRASAAAKTLLRAPIVSELRGAQPDARGGPWDWKFLTLFTWVASLGGGLVVASVDYPGNSRGDHALRGVQRRVRALYEDLILGSVPAPASPPSPSTTPTSTLA
jgi:hypothetical protein